MPFSEYLKELRKVEGLEDFVKKFPQYYESEFELASLMEFVLDGLHQNSKIAKMRSNRQSCTRTLSEACFQERASEVMRMSITAEPAFTASLGRAQTC